MRHFDVQIMGGQVLYEGRIAEMKTGEGKTLVATLPVYARALEGRGVHVVTVNDYLARRDAEWMGPIYEFLGLSVGIIQHGLDSAQRRAAYNCDVTYVTNNEVGFDYLRDNMAWQVEDLVQRELYFALVDEVDSILDRRGAHAADHQRPVARIGRAVRQVRADHSAAEEGRGLHRRREGARGSDHRSRRRAKSRRCSASRTSTSSATSS